MGWCTEKRSCRRWWKTRCGTRWRITSAWTSGRYARRRGGAEGERSSPWLVVVSVRWLLGLRLRLLLSWRSEAGRWSEQAAGAGVTAGAGGPEGPPHALLLWIHAGLLAGHATHLPGWCAGRASAL